MSVEGLDAQASLDVPQRNSLVGAAGAQYIRVRLEGRMVHRINMAAEGVSTLTSIQV